MKGAQNADKRAQTRANVDKREQTQNQRITPLLRIPFCAQISLENFNLA